MTWIGIDFSGNHLQWRDGRTQSAVWIAALTADASGLALRDVRRVQDLPGEGPPFARMTGFLKSASFHVAAIDAPFSLPTAYLPQGGREGLLAAIAALPSNDRPFPTGARLIAAFAPDLGPHGKHVMRAPERLWRRRGINVRSTLWNGPRGGAPFAASSLRLQSACGLPAWPWESPASGKVLAEAFPAAQLKAWALPHDRYGGADAGAVDRRRAIIAALRERARLTMPGAVEKKLIASADALDSVLCAIAARGVATGMLLDPPPADAPDGWIAVHR
jgi:hypothetical protein